MAVAPKTTRQSPATLVELIGRETLQSIQDAFATAFDIPTVILDHEGRNVNAITFRVAFCEDLTRPSRAGDRCLTCDVRAMRESEVTRRPTTFRCWAGLNDSTVPIVSADGRLFGHFLAGQVHFENPSDYSRWREIAAEIGVDPVLYEEAAAQVHVIPEGVYRHRIDCLGILASMIADQASAALANRMLLDEALSANEQTRRMTAELEASASSVPLMAGSDDLFATVARLLDAAHDVVAFDGAAVYVRDAHDDYTPILLSDDGVIGDGVYRSGVTAAVEHAESTLLDGGATLAIPLILDGAPLGAVVLHRHSHSAFTVHDRDLLTIVGGQVTMAIGVSRLRDESQRVLSVASVRDAALRQMAADVDAEVLLRSLLDEALQSLDARDVVLLSRDSSIAAISRGLTATIPRRLDAAVKGALSRAQTTGKPTEARSAGGDATLIIPAAIGSRTGFDLVAWRERDWTPFDVNLTRSLAAGAELIAEMQRRRETSRLGAARQRALAELIGALRVDGVDATDEITRQMAAAAGVETVVRVRASDLEGVLVVSTTDNAGSPVERIVLTQGHAALLTPEPGADAAQWDGWAQRILTALAVPRAAEIICAPMLSTGMHVALIGISRFSRSEEARIRLQTVGDLLDIAADQSRSSPLPDGTSLLLESVFLSAREGRAAVVRSSIAAYRALGGQADPFDPGTDTPDDIPAIEWARFHRCIAAALAIADDVDTAANVEAAASRAQAGVERKTAATRSILDRTWQLVSAIDSDQPAVELVERIGAHWRAPVLLEDAEGWKIAGDDQARSGSAVDLADSDGRLLGRLWSVASAIPEDTTWECLAATITLHQIATTHRHDDALRAAVVDGLIEADAITPDLLRRCTEIDFDPGLSHRACVIGIGDSEAASERVMHWLARWIDNAGAPGIVGRRDRNAILIGPDDASWFSLAVDALGLRFSGVNAGLGHPGTGAPGLQRSYSSGRQASDVLRVTGRTGMLEIQDDSLESILLEAADPTRLVRFVDTIVKPIEEYDSRKGANLLHSLETATRLNWNLQGAARACHVHVTTFRYRLTRIEQLTGLNLSGADGRLTAELALRARRVLS